jgi:DNA-binding beta-propeller fold protein YncE
VKRLVGAIAVGWTLLSGIAAAVEPRILVVGVWPNRVRFLDEATEEFVSEVTLRYGAVTNVFGSDRTADSRRFFFVTDRMEAVEVVDVPSRAVVDEVKLSSPERRVRIYGAAPDRAGTTLFLTVEAVGLEVDRFETETVDVVQYDLESRTVVQSFPLPSEISASFLPPILRVSPDGTSLYVFSGDVFVLDVKSQRILDRVEVTEPRAPGYGPAGFLFLPVESESDPEVFFGIYRNPDPILQKPMLGITRVDMRRREFEAFEIAPDSNVEWLAVSPDETRAYAGMGDLVAMDLTKRKLLARRQKVQQGRQSPGLVASADGTKLFVGGIGPVIEVYDGATLERLRSIEVGGDIMNPIQPIPRSAFYR